MNKLWQILEITEFLIAAIGIPLFVISLIINVICDVAGYESTIIFETTDWLCSFIFGYLWQIWVFLFIINGLHAVSFLLNKQNLDK